MSDKPVVSPQEIQLMEFGSIVIPPVPPVRASPVSIPVPGRLNDKSPQKPSEPSDYVLRVRKEPATEKQKEKLRWFGCTWGDGITKGQASDAIDKCVRNFPDREWGYYNRPATKEQVAKLRKINKRKGNDCLVLAYDPEEPLTYREAKDRIQDWELSRRAYEQQQILSSDLDDCVDSYWEEHHWDDDYEESERGRFDSACSEILDAWNFDKHGDLPNRKQVAEVWELVKSRKPNNAKLPTRGELVAALIELFPRFKSQARASSVHGEPKGADSRNSNPPTESQLKILRACLKTAKTRGKSWILGGEFRRNWGCATLMT